MPMVIKENKDASCSYCGSVREELTNDPLSIQYLTARLDIRCTVALPTPAVP